MFEISDRDRVRDHVVAMAQRDDRIVAAALVGSLALDEGDRWSDVDLSFALADGVSSEEVLREWTDEIVHALDAVHLFDLLAGAGTYRVFLMPECSQLDISLWPASEYRPTSPRFRLLFGTAGEAMPPATADPDELLGWTVLWARDGRVCIERGRWLQAEHSIASLRHGTFSLAAQRRGLPARFGKGFDKLPDAVRDRYASTLVTSLDEGELRRALESAIDVLLDHEMIPGGIPERMEQRLREVLL